MTNKSMAILGLVLSFFIPIAGIIISAIALKKFNESGETDGKGLATAGLVVGIVFIVLNAVVIACTACTGGLLAALADY